MPNPKLNIRKSGDFTINFDSNDREATVKAASEIEEQVRTFIKSNGAEGLDAYVSVTLSVHTPYDEPVSCNTMAKDCYGTAETVSAEVLEAPKSLEEMVFEAIGEASMCWTGAPKGIFDSSRAHQIGERLVNAINGVAPKGGSTPG